MRFARTGARCSLLMGIEAHAQPGEAQPKRRRRAPGAPSGTLEREGDHRPLRDFAEHAQPSAAGRAREHVHFEAAAEERRPVDPRRCGVEQASEQTTPVLHAEDVRREEHGVRARRIKSRKTRRRSGARAGFDREPRCRDGSERLTAACRPLASTLPPRQRRCAGQHRLPRRLTLRCPAGLRAFSCGLPCARDHVTSPGGPRSEHSVVPE
jgi:hypothetical protein